MKQRRAISKVISIAVGISVVAIVVVGVLLIVPIGPRPIEPVEPDRPPPEVKPGPLEPPLAVGEHPAAEQLEQRVETYFEAFEAKDVQEMLSFYVNSRDTFAEWSGQAGVFAGTYQGYGNIRILLSSIIGNINDIQIMRDNYQVEFDGDSATVSMNLISTGHGKLIGEFDMEMDVTTIWEYTDGTWMMIDDRWDFTLFETEIVVEATVFPLHWRKRGDFSVWDKRLAELFEP